MNYALIHDELCLPGAAFAVVTVTAMISVFITVWQTLALRAERSSSADLQEELSWALHSVRQQQAAHQREVDGLRGELADTTSALVMARRASFGASPQQSVARQSSADSSRLVQERDEAEEYADALVQRLAEVHDEHIAFTEALHQDIARAVADVDDRVAEDEDVIGALQAENDQLRLSNDRLAKEVRQLWQDVDSFTNAAMDAEDVLRRLQNEVEEREAEAGEAADALDGMELEVQLSHDKVAVAVEYVDKWRNEAMAQKEQVKELLALVATLQEENMALADGALATPSEDGDVASVEETQEEVPVAIETDVVVDATPNPEHVAVAPQFEPAAAKATPSPAGKKNKGISARKGKRSAGALSPLSTNTLPDVHFMV